MTTSGRAPRRTTPRSSSAGSSGSSSRSTRSASWSCCCSSPARSSKPDTFPTWDNVRNMLTQASVIGVLAIGMTFVIATAGIDLSVGSMVAAAGMFGGVMVDDERHEHLAVHPRRDRVRDRCSARSTRPRSPTAAWCRSSRRSRCSRSAGARAAAQRQAARQPARPERRVVRRSGGVLAALVRHRADPRDPGLGLRLPRDHDRRLGAAQPHPLRPLRRRRRRQPRGGAHRRRAGPPGDLQRLRAHRACWPAWPPSCSARASAARRRSAATSTSSTPSAPS